MPVLLVKASIEACGGGSVARATVIVPPVVLSKPLLSLPPPQPVVRAPTSTRTPTTYTVRECRDVVITVSPSRTDSAVPVLICATPGPQWGRLWHRLRTRSIEDARSLRNAQSRSGSLREPRNNLERSRRSSESNCATECYLLRHATQAAPARDGGGDRRAGRPRRRGPGRPVRRLARHRPPRPGGPGKAAAGQPHPGRRDHARLVQRPAAVLQDRAGHR